LPAVGLVNGLIRPEANLLVVIVFIIVFFSIVEKKRFLFKVAWIYLIPMLAYFIWRWAYYGLLFPLPFYIKSGTFTLAGKDYVLNFLILLFSNLLLYIGLASFNNKIATKLIGIIAIIDLTFYLFVTPTMGYDYRFLFPLVPLILVLSGIGIAKLLQKVPDLLEKKANSLSSVVLIGSIILIIYACNNMPRTLALFSHKLDYANGMIRNHLFIGQTLSKVAHDQSNPVLVITDAGAMAYYSGWRTIDAGGLNDEFIAHGQGDKLGYIFDNDPDVIVLTSNDLYTFTTDSDYVKSIYDKAISEGLVLVYRKSFYQGDSIWILSKTDSEAASLFIQ
jgi:hypothetical protein